MDSARFADPNIRKLNTFSSLDAKAHSMRRRRLTKVYSKSWLQSSTHMTSITGVLLHERLLPILTQHANNDTAVNMLDLCFATGLDFVSTFFFGTASGTNFLQNEGALKRWLEAYNKSHGKDIAKWMQELPNLTKWLTGLGIPVIPESRKAACQELERWALRMCDDAEQILLGRSPGDDNSAGDFPAVYHELKSAIAREIKHPDLGTLFDNCPEYRLEIASELLDHLGMSLLFPSHFACIGY